MNLIYHYSTKNSAPARDTSELFKCLYTRRKELPFENITLVVPSNDILKIKDQFPDVNVITGKNLRFLKNSLVHIPEGNVILPNDKYLLHILSRFNNNKLILHYHGDSRTEMKMLWDNFKKINFFYIPTYILLPYHLRSCDKLVLNSYHMLDLVKEKYGLKNGIVIPNGLENYWFESHQKIELEGDPILFYHGRLSPEKGVETLIKAFSNSIRNSPKAKLYIAGDGPLRNHLEKLCVKYGTEKNIIFLGILDKQTIQSYLISSDVSIYPSIYEPFSNAILEALSSTNGPVFFSNLVGLNDFIKLDGYKFNSFESNIKSIEKIINNFFGNYMENNNNYLISQQKQFALKYSWDNITNRYIELYKDTVG